MYPFNINTEGEIIELSNKASSIDTHNDEDAIIIYDEQDQESSNVESFKNQNKKHSNLFNSSFMSDLSSVHNSKKKDFLKSIHGEQNIESFKNFGSNDKNNAMIILEDNNDSFLDKELNLDSIPFDTGLNDDSLGIIQDDVDQFDE